MDKDPIFKVVDTSRPNETHYYVFLGEQRYERLKDILDKWGRMPRLGQLSQKDHRRLEKEIGHPDWDIKLGLPEPSPWAYTLPPETAPRSLSPGSKSKSKDGKPARRSKSMERALSPQRLEEMRNAHAQKFRELRRRQTRDDWTYHFVPLTIFSDDTVHMLRAKIYCALVTENRKTGAVADAADPPIPPEWQILSYRLPGDTYIVPGTFFYERKVAINPFENDSPKEPEVGHPLGDFAASLIRLQTASRSVVSSTSLEANDAWAPLFKILNKRIRIDYAPDVLWTTHGHPVNHDIRMTSLAAVAATLRDWLERTSIAPILQDPLRHGFLPMYAPATSRRVQDLLDLTFRKGSAWNPAAIHALATEGLTDFCAHVREDNRRMEIIARLGASHAIQRRASQLAITGVGALLRSPFEQPGAMPVREIFDSLEMERGLIFAEYFGAAVGKNVPLTDRWIKLHTGPESLNVHELEKSLLKGADTTKIDSHPNRLKLKFLFPHIKQGTASLTIHDTGKARIVVNWTGAMRADMDDLARIYREVAEYIEKVIHPIVREKRDSSRLLPSLPQMDVFDGRPGNMELTSMIMQMHLENGKLPEYDLLRTLLENLSPFFEPVASPHVEAWLQDPKIARIAPLVRAAGLSWTFDDLITFYNRPLSKEETQTISVQDLTTARRLLRQRIDQQRKSIQAVYRRYNGHQGEAHMKRFLLEYLRQNRKTLMDLNSPETYSRLVRHVIRNQQLSPADASESIRNAIYALSNDSAKKDPKQLRLQMYADTSTIEIQGLKNFKNHSSIVQLLSRIEWLFVRLAVADVPSLIEELERQNGSAPIGAASPEELFDLGGTNLQEMPTDDPLDDFILNSWMNENVDDSNENVLEDAQDFDGPLLDMKDVDDEGGVDAENQDADQEEEDGAKKPRAAMRKLVDSLEKEEYEWKLSRLQRFDPEIFNEAFYEDGKKKQLYSRRCSKERQPVVMTPAEYESQVADAQARGKALPFKLPAAAPQGFLYRGNYYVCPMFWCDKMSRAVSIDELKDVHKNSRGEVVRGTCPDGSAVLTNLTTNVYPSFYKVSLADGLAVPCCNVSDWSRGSKRARYEKLLGPDGPQIAAPSSPSDPMPVEVDIGPKPVSQLSYIKSHKKDEGVSNNRYAYLDPLLDRLFNDYQASPSTQDPKFRRVLRMGVLMNVDHTLACVLKLYNLWRIHELGQPPLTGELEFRNHLASHLQDETLVTSLGRGAIRSRFEYFVGYNYLAAFRSYLLQERIDETLLWELCARPLPWLFPEGLSLVLLQRPGEKDTDITLRCPPPHLVRFLRKAPRTAFIVQLTPDVSHIIVDIEPILKPKPFFPPEHPAVQAVADALVECAAGAPPEEEAAEDVLQTLREAGHAPRAQWMHGLYRLKGLIVDMPAGSVVLPLAGDPSVLPEIPIVRRVDYPSVSVAQKAMKELASILGDSWNVVRWAPRYESGPQRIGALVLKNGLFVPVAPTAARDAPERLPLHGPPFIDIDEDLWREVSVPDDRVRVMTDLYFTQQLYQSFLREISGFLRKELTLLPEDAPPAEEGGKRGNGWHRRYWFVLYDILQAKRPLSEKQNAIIHLFVHGFPSLGLKPLLSILISHEEAPDIDRPKETSARGRQQCFDRPTTIAGPRNCMALSRCTVSQNKCKLYVPRNLRDRFLVWFVEDLLRNRLRRAHILNNRWNDATDHARLEITPNMLVFDASMAELIYRLVKNPEEVHRMNTSIMEKGPMGRERRIMNFFASRNLDKLKSKGEFGTILRSLPGTLQQHLPGFLVRSSQHILQNLWFAVSHLPEGIVPTSEQRFRGMLMDYVQREGMFQVYLQRQMQDNNHFRGIRSMVTLREFFLSDNYTGTIRDLDLVAGVFPLDIYVLRTTTRGTWLERRICSNLPGAFVSIWLVDSQKHLQLLVQSTSDTPSGDRTFRHIFQHSNLPDAFFQRFRLSSTTCTPYRHKGSPLLHP